MRIMQQDLPTSVHKAKKLFRMVIIGASKISVPMRRITIIRPDLPTVATKLDDQRDDLRSTNSQDPVIGEMNTKLNKLVEHKRTKWCDFLKGVSLNSARSHKTAAKIIFADSKKCTDYFNKQFSSEPPQKYDRNLRTIFRKYEYSATDIRMVFMHKEVIAAINHIKIS